MVELRNVTVSKNGRKLFKDFSFQIRPGENWVVQGLNGSGKTLLLQLIAGEAHAFSGRVDYSFVHGHDWNTLYQQRRKKIHMVATHGVSTFLSGFGGLFYQQRYYAMDNTQLPKVRDIFGDGVENLKTFAISDNFSIAGFLDLPVTRLSNGQLKKVMILQQLVKNIPKLLLLDYPFDGLDAESRRDFNRFLDYLANSFGIQIVLVDHGHALPDVINRRLILNTFEIEKIETVTPTAPDAGRPETKRRPEAIHGGQPMVEMQNVTIEYGGKKILSDINWRINKGERWALTGKNGSGKTTLFSLIYADHPMAYSQKVFLFGRRRGTGESIWDIKRRINYLGPEQLHFLDAKTLNISAREYVLMQPHNDPDRLEALLGFFNIETYFDQPMRFLSSGQLQMILLLNAFLDDRELLLLDEPFQFLDPHNHGRITEYLTNRLDSEITLVLITHDEKDVALWTRKRKHL